MPKIKLIVDGGSMKPGPAVAQQLGPMGINMGKVIEDVNSATTGFKGMKVPVELDVDPKTKTYTVEVFSPPVAELVKKELGLEKAGGEAGKMFVANVSVEKLIGIAKTKQVNLLAKDLKAALKLVVGTCVSMSVLVDNKPAKEVEEDIDSGKYDAQIDGGITEPSEEKKKEMDAFWKDIAARQEKSKKALAEAQAAEEAAKAEKAAAAPAAGGDAKKEEPKKK
ncbi:MAG: 50S ribosomal protein L11 [Nanoarchaeota archaeon]|nr:50S ribosomal protein L11 [Nanoarchaeota archaeon]